MQGFSFERAEELRLRGDLPGAWSVLSETAPDQADPLIVELRRRIEADEAEQLRRESESKLAVGLETARRQLEHHHVDDANQTLAALSEAFPESLDVKELASRARADQARVKAAPTRSGWGGAVTVTASVLAVFGTIMRQRTRPSRNRTC